MHVKASVFLFFAVLGLVVLPVAIVSQSHLYADGAAFFVAILESGKVDVAGHTLARVGHHVMTQVAATAAMKCGISSVRHLSWLYGIGLFYLPWFAYMLASLLFIRSKMILEAILVTMIYCLLTCFTSFFIISESHLGASLFVLTLATIVTCDLKRWPARMALLFLWLLSLSAYEFWAIFFPVCLVVLAAQPRARLGTRRPAGAV